MKYLAFDIGGTNLKYGIITLQGKIIQSWVEEIPSSYKSLLEVIKQKFEDIEEISGIGLSVPGIYDSKKRVMTGSSALSYIIGKKLKTDLEEIIPCPVTIENDGNCALLGEYWQGNCKNSNSSVIYVIGSAVGGSIQIHGELIRGENSNAGELGYCLIDNNPEQNTYGSLGGKVGINSLLKYVNDKGYSFRNGYELLSEGEANKDIERLLLNRLEYFAAALMSIQYIIDPEVILIGGGVSQNSYFMSLINRSLTSVQKKRPNHIVKPTIMPAQYGNNANLLGAVYNLRKELGQ